MCCRKRFRRMRAQQHLGNQHRSDIYIVLWDSRRFHQTERETTGQLDSLARRLGHSISQMARLHRCVHSPYAETERLSCVTLSRHLTLTGEQHCLWAALCYSHSYDGDWQKLLHREENMSCVTSRRSLPHSQVGYSLQREQNCPEGVYINCACDGNGCDTA